MSSGSITECISV